MDPARRSLGLAYLYPALLLGFAAASLFTAYRASLGLACPRSPSLACNDMVPYFTFETAVFVATAFLSYRAIKRTRRGRKDLWTLRVYWPIILGALGGLAFVGYLVSTLPSRGCDVGLWTPVYFLYGCWDPGVTLLRVLLACGLTAGFMTFVTRLPESAWWTATRARGPPPGADAGAPPENVDEIPAR